jgi:hypothetical protein
MEAWKAARIETLKAAGIIDNGEMISIDNLHAWYSVDGWHITDVKSVTFDASAFGNAEADKITDPQARLAAQIVSGNRALAYARVCARNAVIALRDETIANLSK